MESESNQKSDNRLKRVKFFNSHYLIFNIHALQTFYICFFYEAVLRNSLFYKLKSRKAICQRMLRSDITSGQKTLKISDKVSPGRTR